MTFFCQIQESYVDIRNGNTVSNTLRDIPEVEGEVLGDKENLALRLGLVERTRNGEVWKDVGVVLVTSIVECGCNFDSEGEDASDYLNGRGRCQEKGIVRMGGRRRPTSTLRMSQCKRGRPEFLEVWRGRKSATCTTPFSLRNLV